MAYFTDSPVDFRATFPVDVSRVEMPLVIACSKVQCGKLYSYSLRCGQKSQYSLST